ncbi:glycoside hydrolase family 3 protein, partial [Clostridium saudiense]|nr:glycoside hydrolase family 3 protein [Clostridium saudiense]
MVDLKSRPFYLDDSKVKKVYEVFEKMTEEEKIGQIFCPIGTTFEEEEITDFISKYKPGAMMYRPVQSAKAKEIHENLQRSSNIPLLLAANLESGGIGICEDGTYYGRQMEIAASNNLENAYNLGSICGKEANAVGCNWSFAPIIDIDLNYRNPITNVRTYGDNIDRIINMASKQIEGLRENNVVPCIKHFPGDGVDERDQHLLSSVNDLSVDEWDKSYGAIYKS